MTLDRTQSVADLGCANSDQGSVTTGECTQPTQWVHLEYPAWVIGEAVPDTYCIKAHYQDTESKQLYLTHGNKHREAVKIRRQRNMAQMKKQIKTPEKEPNEMEIGNLSDAEFKTLVVRMLRKLNANLRSSKKMQSEVKNTLIKIKNNL